MSIYKITNITNLAGKRDYKFNSDVEIEYIDGLEKKNIIIKPGDTTFLTISSLPLSVHRLRVKNLITVLEVGDAELTQSIERSKPQMAIEDKSEIEIKKILPKKKVI